jgi:hypothetical protein
MQVEEFYVITWESTKEQIFEMPTGGAAIMRKGPNLLKFARKEQCLALTTQLRTKYKFTPCFYRVFPSGVCSFSRMITHSTISVGFCSHRTVFSNRQAAGLVPCAGGGLDLAP